MKKVSQNEFKADRKPFQFKIELNEEQKLAKAGVYNYDVSFFVGEAGSGKTQLMALVALDLLFKKKIEKIVVTRTVLPSSLGFLPGTLEEKMAPMIYPIKHCFYQATGDRVLIDKLFEERVIEIMSFDFAKGVTFCNAMVCVDEFQDCTEEDFRLILTRLGKDSKMILCGSEQQVDRRLKKTSCIDKVMNLKYFHDLTNFCTLKTNHRNSIIFQILNRL